MTDSESPDTMVTTASSTEPSMAKDFRLQPVGLGKERLQAHLLPIPVNHTDKGSCMLAIGRTAVLAGDYHKFISREHVLISIVGGKLHITSKAQANCVHVNSLPIEIGVPVELAENDVVSLLGPKQYFNYQVHLVDHVQTSSPKKRARGASGQVVAKQVKKHNSGGIASTAGQEESDSVKNTAECSICLELMALCYSVVPCGHNFCYSCVTDWMKQNKKCPTCTTNILNTIPCRMLDDIIRATVITRNATDVAAFEARYAEGLKASKKKTPALTTVPKPHGKNKISSFFEVVDLS